MPATPVAVVTDSTHYLPRELVRSRGIHVVSLYVNQGGVITKESDMPDFEAFYDGLRTSADLPTTSQPSIGDFIEVYEPLVAAGHDIVSVHISGGLSGTVESARQAAAELGAQRRIEIVDSQSTCGGLGRRRPRGAGGRRRRRRRRAGRPARARRDRRRRRSGSPSTRWSSCSAAGASAARRPGSAAR